MTHVTHPTHIDVWCVLALGVYNVDMPQKCHKCHWPIFIGLCRSSNRISSTAIRPDTVDTNRSRMLRAACVFVCSRLLAYRATAFVRLPLAGIA
jgi:hypothetical protein